MQYDYSVVIPTRRTATDIIPTLQSLAMQLCLPIQIFIVRDVADSVEGFEKYKQTLAAHLDDIIFAKITFVSLHTYDFTPHKGVSYVRNYGLKLVNTPAVLCVDDDNTFDKYFVKQLYQTWDDIQTIQEKPAIITPTEYYDGQIRSRGQGRFIYRMGIQRPINDKKKGHIYAGHEVLPIAFCASNCLFGATSIFHQVKFDERMQFVYEDFDMTARTKKAGYGLYVIKDIHIDHHMTKKIGLEATYIADEKAAFQKGQNRVLFVKHIGNWCRKLQYFILGLRIHTAFLVLSILLSSDTREHKKGLIRAIFQGTKHGLRWK